VLDAGTGGGRLPNTEHPHHDLLSEAYLPFITVVHPDQVDPIAFFRAEAKMLKRIRNGDADALYDFMSDYIDERLRLQTSIGGKRSEQVVEVLKAQRVSDDFPLLGENGLDDPPPKRERRERGTSLNPFAPRA
jgi:hypothetical protein